MRVGGWGWADYWDERMRVDGWGWADYWDERMRVDGWGGYALALNPAANSSMPIAREPLIST